MNKIFSLFKTIIIIMSLSLIVSCSKSKGGDSSTDNYTPSDDFREETIYSVILTRFYDGDSSNNYYNRDRIVNGDPTWRGDIKGLISKLDYIHDDLGFTSIMITPVITNRGGLDYAGENPYDFTKVDPRLESAGATFQDLIREAHSRGIRIILRITLNHTSYYGIRNHVFNNVAPIKYYKRTAPFPSSEAWYPYTLHLGDYKTTNREDNDNPLAPDIFRVNDPDGALTVTCPRCGVNIAATGFAGYQNHDPNHFFNVDAATLNTTWYHQSGFMAGGDWENPIALQNKHMAGDFIDLALENTDVKTYILSAYKKYIDMGVDALCIDNIRHISRTELLEYINTFKSYNPDLFIFGENMVKGTGWGSTIDPGDTAPAEIRPWWYTRTTTDPAGSGSDDSGLSVMDYSLFSTFRDNLSLGRFSGLSAIFSRDNIYGDATTLVTFIDNMNTGPQNDWKYRFNGTDTALASSLNFLWTARGIPSLFYGTEIRFKSGLEINGTDAPHDNSGRAYFGENLTDDNITATRSNKFAVHIKRLNLIRRSCAALQKGVMELYGDDTNRIWFARNYNNKESYAVVGLAQVNSSFNVSGVPAGTYRDAVTGNEIVVPEGGTLSFSVLSGSAGIYILNGPGKVGDDGVYLR